MKKYTRQDNISKDKFEFVQHDEKIYDKKFETKPVGYFKDALIRFAKNRTNVIATTILFTLILLAILVPRITTKNYTTLDSELDLLPPRIPILEKFGIADGTKKYEGIPVDLSTIDPVTGIGYPKGKDPVYVVDGTLKNLVKVCTSLEEDCLGGEGVLTLRNNSVESAIQSTKSFMLDKDKNSKITIDIKELTANSKVYVEVSVDNFANSIVIGEITSKGVKTFNYADVTDAPSFVMSKLRLRLVNNATNTSRRLAVTSVKLEDSTKNEPLIYDEGIKVVNYEIAIANSAFYARENGRLLTASFKYDEYSAALLGLKKATVSEQQLKNTYAKGCKIIESTKTDKTWEYEDGCTTKRVTNVIPQYFKGEILYDYELEYDYSAYKGFDGMPYYFFGTTAAGKDYFALVWLGLRTSLILGFVVASINIFIGVIYGAIEGYYGGLTDLLMERFGEILGRIPWLVWLSLFIIIFGTGFKTIVILLTVTGWLGIASVTRTQFYRYKGREYVLASRTLGASDRRLIFRHILPNGIGTLITASVLSIPLVIFSESTVSYLGYGIGAGSTFKVLGIELSGESLGVLMANARNDLTTNPYLTLFPAIVISILMITFNMFGNALRDAFNPSLRGSE